MLPRQLSAKIQATAKSVLLLGPRQTGKSTLIKALAPDLTINLALEAQFLRFARDAEELPSQLRRSKARTVFIDEVQRLPSLLNTIQALLDDAAPGELKFYLSGSSARKLRRGEANLLPGRIIACELGPLTALELGDDFDAYRALAHGTLPGIYLDDDQQTREMVLDAYSAVYVKEEIQAEALTRNIEGFSRFLFIAASRNGDFVDLSKLASDAAIQRKTAGRYIEILEETLIAHQLEAFAKSRYRRLIQHPKLFFFDTGVLNALLGGYDVTTDRIGGLFETLIHSQIRAAAAAITARYRLSTYRTENGAEVDFIFEYKNEIWAIEVKASKNVGKNDLSGLKSFGDFIGKPCRRVVIYLGSVEKEIEGVWITPLSNFLSQIFT